MVGMLRTIYKLRMLLVRNIPFSFVVTVPNETARHVAVVAEHANFLGEPFLTSQS